MSFGTSSIKNHFVKLKSAFTKPSFSNFCALAEGWILCLGRHSISRVIQFMPTGDTRHTRFYDFFSRSHWEPDELSALLIPMVQKLIPQEMTVHAAVDDTLAYRSGAHIWGAGMHYDALRSNYGRGAKRVVSLAFGHSWVIVSLLVPPPWSRARLLAIPVLFRLYRSKKTCPVDDYLKRSELAAELVELLCRWLPSNRRLRLLGDDEYASRIVAQRIAMLVCEADADNRQKRRRCLPEKIDLCGPMTMDAAFYDLPTPHIGRGRPRKKGSRLPSPKQLAADDSKAWKAQTLFIYGREVEILTKTQVGLWCSVTGSTLVRMVVTRDPKGRIDDRAYFTTDATMTVEQVVISYSHRWSQEVLHRNLKQYFGLDDPQNGWWRHPGGERKDARRPGPAPHETRGSRAALRTVPFVMVVYAIVELWYFQNGHAANDVARARCRAPWNVKKREPSFADRLAAARRGILFPDIFEGTPASGGSVEINLDLLELLLAA
jgi:hypothetical protein